MNTWIEPGYLEDLSSIYREKNLFELMPEVITDKLRYRGGIYAIPINIHRENVLWYNVSVFERYEISPPQTHEELMAVMEKLAARGVTPLALGDRNEWPASHLFESIMVANLGEEKYRGLWDGTSEWDSPQMESALEQFLHVMEYVNSDHGALTWDEAVQYMVDGKCAMTVMGDFAEGYLTATGLTPGEDFGWVPFPETSGVFVMNSDTFALPKGAVHQQNAWEWIELIGSQKGQDAFNPKKGSIPARRDCRRKVENYDAYQKSAIRAFRENEIVNSFTHSSVATDPWRNELNRIVEIFMAEKDVSRALRLLAEAGKEHL
jgi:glucose/mannose transport system substrate-binding protein